MRRASRLATCCFPCHDRSPRLSFEPGRFFHLTFSKRPTQRRTTNAAENLVQFSAALASAASNPATALTARLLFDRGMVFTAATFRTSCPLVSDSLLSRFRTTGRVGTTRAPSVRAVVTRAVLCMTKYRTFGSSWFRLRTERLPFAPASGLFALSRKSRRRRAAACVNAPAVTAKATALPSGGCRL